MNHNNNIYQLFSRICRKELKTNMTYPANAFGQVILQCLATLIEDFIPYDAG